MRTVDVDVKEVMFENVRIVERNVTNDTMLVGVSRVVLIVTVVERERVIVVEVNASIVRLRVRVSVSFIVTVISVVPLNEHTLVLKLVIVVKPL